MKDIVILSAVRTAVGKYGGTLKDFKATDLGAEVVQESVKRAELQPEDIQECIMGLVLGAGLGQNPARQAAVNAGLPVQISSFTVNKVCGSGMKSVMLAANSIRAGEHDVVVAGGMENMSSAPYAMPGARWGYRINDQRVVDTLVHDGLWDIFSDQHMGLTAEITAQRHSITREEADAFSYRSHMYAMKAAETGAFDDEIMPVNVRTRKGELSFAKDEGVRTDTSLEALARLKPAFKPDGVVTAGNASQLSDGAAALVIASQEFAEERGIEPLATIVGYHSEGVEPKLIMEAPIPTTRHLMERCGLTMGDLDLFEHNEAFATASLAVQRSLGVPEDIFNVNGGAIALGHPIGCSGARLLTTLVHAMKRRGAETGLATLCLGGGNATSMIVRL